MSPPYSEANMNHTTRQYSAADSMKQHSKFPQKMKIYKIIPETQHWEQEQILL